jgi:hypothetical protein
MSLAAEAFETIQRGGAGASKADGNREELSALRRAKRQCPPVLGKA